MGSSTWKLFSLFSRRFSPPMDTAALVRAAPASATEVSLVRAVEYCHTYTMSPLLTMTWCGVMVMYSGSMSMYFESTGLPMALHRISTYCPLSSSARVANTQCSPAARMVSSCLTYFTCFSSVVTSQNTTQCSTRSSLLKPYTTVWPKYPQA